MTKAQRRKKFYTFIGIANLIAIILLALRGQVLATYVPDLITPLPANIKIEKTSTLEDESRWVAQAIEEFIPTHQQQSEAMMILHCLLHRESTHGLNYGRGDNGMAGGILQYWQDTWVRVKTAMISNGVATEIGSRLDPEDAVRSTVWVLWQSRLPRSERKASIVEWGPIYREVYGATAEGSANCPIPSWLKI